MRCRPPHHLQKYKNHKKKKMKAISPEEMRKMREFIAHVQEELHHQIRIHEEEFKKSDDGMEAMHLQEIHDHNRAERYFIHFFAGKKGKRNIDMTLEYLRAIEKKRGDKSPFSEKLTKFDEEFQKKIKKGDILDWEMYYHYEKIMHAVQQLQPKDIDDFRKEFNDLLVKATRFKETVIAKTILEENIPEFAELDNYKAALRIWEFIQAKLVLPPPNFRGIAELEAEIAKKSGKNVEGFRKEAGLPNEKETENWDNFTTLDKMLSRQGRSHIIIKLLDKTGQARFAEEILVKGIKQGRQKMLDSISRHVEDMKGRQEQERVEDAAKKKLAGMIFDMIQKAHDEMKKEMAEFSKLVSSRIKDLEKAHAKRLVELKKMKTELDSLAEEIQFSVAAGSNITRNATDAIESLNAHRERQFDIDSMIHAMTLALAETDIRKFNSGIEDILSKRPATFAVDKINRIKDAVNRRARDEISVVAFEKELDDIHRFIERVAKQIPVLKQGKEKIYSMLRRFAHDRLDRKLDDFSNVVYFDFPKAYKLATEYSRKLKKMGLENSRHSIETPRPEEVMRAA